MRGNQVKMKKTIYIALTSLILLSSGALAADQIPVIKADFSISPITSHTTKFTDKSTGSSNSWAWTFGYGTFSKSENPIHTFEKTGKYIITLTAMKGKQISSKSKVVSIPSQGITLRKLLHLLINK